MIGVSFDEINKETIDRLIREEVSEGKTIEYKLKLPGGCDEDKREFLADVSSFANAAGGHILYGMKEDEGKPTAAPGLEGINLDAEILRLEQTILSGIDPRIAGVHTKGIFGFTKGPVIVMRIPKSWTAPHMVVFKKLSRFYSRNSAGKYQLDVDEIGRAFALSEELPRRIRQFRDERVARIIADETPFTLLAEPRAVLHVIPMTAADPATRLDVPTLQEATRGISGPQDYRWDYRLNLDGLLRYMMFGNECAAYMQFYRTGAVEYVDAFALEKEERGGERSPVITGIWPYHMQKTFIDAFSGIVQFLDNCGLQPPVFAFLTVTGTKDLVLFTQPEQQGMRMFARELEHFFDREPVLLPELLVENLAEQAAHILRPAFDMFWQAAGYDRCLDYDQNRNWREHRTG